MYHNMSTGLVLRSSTETLCSDRRRWFQVEEGTRIEVPEECNRGRAVLSSSGRLGGYGDEFTWPLWTDAQGNSPRPELDSHSADEGCREVLLHESVGQWLVSSPPSFQRGNPDAFIPGRTPALSRGGGRRRGLRGPVFYSLLEPCSAPFDRLDLSRKYTSESQVAAKKHLHMVLDLLSGAPWWMKVHRRVKLSNTRESPGTLREHG